MSGSIRQRGPDQWQVRVSLGKDPETGKYSYVTRTVNGGKRAAQKAADQLATEAARGAIRPQRRRTVAELFEKWLEHLEGQGRADTTLVRYRSVVANDLLPAFGRMRVEDVTAADLDALYARLRKRGLAPLSVRKVHAVMSSALHQAERWGWIDRSPAFRASPPPANQPEIVVPERSEIRRILDAAEAKNPDLATLIYVAATTGLRRGELCGLRWSDFDPERATLVVRRAISDVPGKVAAKTTKTHQSRRIALDRSTVAVLLRHHVRASELAERAGVEVVPTGYVFSQEVDGSVPWRPGRITTAFQTLRDKAGLPDVTFHSLRHFSATTLAGTGVGVRTIAGRLGHANPSVTLRTYSHFLEAADREAAELMAGVAESLLPPASSTSG